MTIPLKDALQELLQDWRDDLSPPWRRLVAGVELGFEEVDADLELHPWEPIFPSRRHFVLPGEPSGAHMFRAFDQMHPEAVRCVVLGQDPYPSIDFATGRSFEAGGYHRWDELEKMSSCSVRSLIQSVYGFRSGQPRLCETTGNWSEVLRAIAPDSGFPAPDRLAQEWVEQGVLLLNASLTLSRFSKEGGPHQLRGHLPLWRPLMAHLIGHFADRATQPVVFLLLGDAARQVAAVAGLAPGGEPDRHPAVVAMPHPAAGDDFLRLPNPFNRCNEKLLAMKAEPIRW